jgi:hypothetical protein
MDRDLAFMMHRFSLGSYVQLVEYTARLFRQGKASISAELAGIVERLGCRDRSWQARVEKLRDGRLPGGSFVPTRAKPRGIAANASACGAR